LKKEGNNHQSFKFEFRGEVPMKGKPRPIQMWLLSRQKHVDILLEEVQKCPFATMMKKHNN
jgi:hypothetical protein